MKKIFLTIFMFFFIASVFSQEKLFYDLYYYLNPKHSIKTYNKILLVTNASNESKKHMRHASKKAKYNVILFDDLFPPYKEWSEDDINSMIEEVGIDALLVINITNVNTYQSSSSYSMFLPSNGFTYPSAISRSTSITKAGSTDLEIFFRDNDTADDEFILYADGYVKGKPLDAAYKTLYNLLKKFEKIGVAHPPSNFKK